MRRISRKRENLWSKLKIILRSLNTKNYQELGKAREFAFSQVSQQDICPVIYTLLLLYLIYLRKARSR